MKGVTNPLQVARDQSTGDTVRLCRIQCGAVIELEGQSSYHKSGLATYLNKSIKRAKLIVENRKGRKIQSSHFGENNKKLQ